MLACSTVVAWHFLPHNALPPERTGTILDRASSGPVLTFNHGGPNRRKLLLMSGEDIWEIPAGTTYYSGINGGVVLSSDGQRVLSYGSIFDLGTKRSRVLQNPEPRISVSQGGSIPNSFSLSIFSNGGTFIAAARTNGSIHLFDASTGQVLHVLRRGMTSVPPGGEPCNITSLNFSPKDSVLASGELNGYISLWSTATGDLIGTLPSQDNPACDESAAQVPYPDSAVQALAFSPTGGSLASKDGFGIVRVWNVASGKALYVLPSHLPGGGRSEVEFSPNGRFLVTSGSALQGEMVLVWDVTNGHLLRGMALPGVATFDFLPGGDLVVAQLVGERVKVERWATRTQIQIPLWSRNTPALAATDSALLQAYEEQALSHLGFLQSSLGVYTWVGKGKGSFPRSLEEVGADSARQRFRQRFRNENCGYQYIYTPGLPDPQGNVASYVISARPLLYQQTGTRSFQIDQTGQVHATTEGRDASASDPIFRTIQSAVQLAQNAAAQPPPETAQTPQSATAAQDEIAGRLVRAQMLYRQRQYQAAIALCDAALRLDPSNKQAANLKSQIQQTLAILGAR